MIINDLEILYTERQVEANADLHCTTIFPLQQSKASEPEKPQVFRRSISNPKNKKMGYTPEN